MPTTSISVRLHRFVLPILILLASVGVGGCVSLDETGPIDRDHLARILQSRGLDPRLIILPYHLTDDMKHWAHETAPPMQDDASRLELLNDRLLDIDQMAVEYSWGYTGTAIEVFENRKANCLAFTNLFLGMAREVGVPAYFVAVENVESYRREGSLVVVSDHVAVGWGEANSQIIYDFSENPEPDYRFIRKISDLTAIAMFYSNRGAEALQVGLVDDALRWLDVATRIDPALASAWVNLGVVQRHAGHFDAAEASYKQALDLDPRIYSAYHNLASLLRLLSRDEEAVAYEGTLERSPNRNPYTYLSLGDVNLRAGQFDDAERYYRRAVNLSDDDPEVFAALGQVALATGDLRLARRMLRKARAARETVPHLDGSRVAVLEAALDPQHDI
ncbi:MAG: tetratricopeptide repeat protein [Acidobacteriota bacterium]